MSSFRASQVLVLVSTLAILPAFGSRTHHAHKRKAVSHLHGQRAIDSNRATEIQNVLIEKKYLSGAATGQWDAPTQVAMRQYQQDHGWQTKLTPDSRALISLGLGPKPTADPTVRQASTANSAPAAAAAADEAPSAEPTANTLASVHSLSQ